MKQIFLLFLVMPLFFFAQKDRIPYKIFNYDSRTCNGYQHSSGSLIFIPTDAFELEGGETCAEKITIKYREFHSQMDMFYGGMNMLLNQDGKYRLLESVGMFEIQAWCGNKRLVLKEGKSIQVRMKTRRNLDNLKSFVYDTIKNTWSEYQSRVVDFSYLKDNNKKDSSSVWGPADVNNNADREVNLEIAEMEGYKVQLPEGYFKGMDLKKLGIFNYDGVIKDSLAIPMVPEFFVVQDGSKIDQKVYVVYETKNTLVYYTPDQFKELFVLLNVKGIRMFTQYKDGSVACLKPGQLDNTDLETFRGKAAIFNLEKQPLKPKSEKELAKATGLNTK